MRGYKRLSLTDRIFVIDELLSRMRQERISAFRSNQCPILFENSSDQAELILRQRASKIRYVLTISLLLKFSGKLSWVICPLPKEWNEFLKAEGYSVPVRLNTMLWIAYTVFCYLQGLSYFFKVSKDFLFNVKSVSFPRESFVFFLNLRRSNFPIRADLSRDFSLLGWVTRNGMLLDGVKRIVHDATDSDVGKLSTFELSYRGTPIPKIDTSRQFWTFLAWSVKLHVSTIYFGLRGHWWYFLLNKECVEAKLFDLASDNSIARSYWFHNGIYFPPLWTYSASKRGAEILMYFYSTNSEAWVIRNGIAPPSNMYGLMNWRNYLVWDEHQRRTVLGYSNPTAKVKVVGPIPFYDSEDELPRIGSPSVGVFDIQPHRRSQYVKYGLPVEYYTPEVVSRFLTDIYEISVKRQVLIAYKSKRKLGKIIHPTFKSFLRSFVEAPNIRTISSEVSAFEVIDSVDVVVSIPFTSTALIARDRGKPSIYYDPIAITAQHEPASHGIPVIRSKVDLGYWLDSNISNKRQFTASAV